MIEAMGRKYWCEKLTVALEAHCSLQGQLQGQRCSELFRFLLRSEGTEVPRGIKDQVSWPSSQWTRDVKLRSCLFVPGSELFSIYSIWLSCFAQWLPQRKAEPWHLDETRNCPEGGQRCSWCVTLRPSPVSGDLGRRKQSLLRGVKKGKTEMCKTADPQNRTWVV